MSKRYKTVLNMSLMDRERDSSEPTALTILRCRKCRKCLVESCSLLSMGNSGELSTLCRVWHMNVDNLPDWVQTAVHQARWTVGKLNCPFCGARLGSFNFVNCSRCPCGQEDVVHVSKSRVDHDSRKGPSSFSPSPSSSSSSSSSVVPIRPLPRARMRRAWGPAGRTSSQDELREVEAAERMVRVGSEGCLPEAQSSCPAILRLIGTSTPITPSHRLGSEAAVQLEGHGHVHMAALPSSASTTQALSGFCGISSLSCFGESSLKRLLDLAEVETVRLGSSERHSPLPTAAAAAAAAPLLLGPSQTLSPPPETSEDNSGDSNSSGSTHLSGLFESAQQRQEGMGTLVTEDAVTFPDLVLLHDEPRPASPVPSNRVPTDSADEDGDVEEDYEEGGDGDGDGDWATTVPPRAQDSPPPPPAAAAAAPALPARPGATGAEYQLSKREKNRLKSQRRKRRKIERWLRSQLEEGKGEGLSPAGSEDEEEREGHTCAVCLDVYFYKDVLMCVCVCVCVCGLSPAGSEDEEEREGHTCAVCLDVYFSPHMCQPCGHVFCEPCLRTLAKNRPASTPCPLCRTTISHTLFQKELNQTSQTFFPKEYLSRKQTFQKANYAKWPLPHCPKRFRIFWGFQREGGRAGAGAGRWQFPNRHFGLDALDLVDMRVWPFDIDLVIIYVYSVHWILAFLILCFVGYCFFF
ncbi:E3 ubiquitin-protein ligase RNF180 [Engraulis encrasicolus]|uniref:E3 ubiquitin-protein ligase RNF180 n=1 Tax=Engraulis encrasicolus TaxID=184585 RepID=UPI002FD32D35